MPNFVANLADEFKGRAADPGNDYLAPWQSLMTGLGVNTKKTTRFTKVSGLWDPKLKGKIVLLTELRDTVDRRWEDLRADRAIRIGHADEALQRRAIGEFARRRDFDLRRLEGR